MEQFRRKVEAYSLSERKELGYNWHPVKVTKTGFSFGDRAYVIVERAYSGHHTFRSGNIVKLVSQKDPNNDYVVGTINYLKNNQLKLVFQSELLPIWIDNHPLTVELLFDERTYREMQRAIAEVARASNNRLADLRDIFFGKLHANFAELAPIELSHLNASQNQALQGAFAAEDIAVIHGPPGTGKTTTVVATIKIATQKGQVLVCAPSNAAVDLLVERSLQAGLKVVRIGNISRVNEAVLQSTMDAQLANHPEYKEIKKVKIKANEQRRKAERFKRNFGTTERIQRKEAYREARELNDWARHLEDRLLSQIISSADVIACTLVGAAHPVLKDYRFHTVFIDEAAQGLEPATWIPILKSNKVVLAGDPFQLPPTVKSQKAQNQGLIVTLMERLIDLPKLVFLLKVQYRMHAQIMGFSNRRFYDNKLIADISVENHKLEDDQEHSVVFIDTAGTGFDEHTDEKEKSRYNPDEVRLIFEHLHQIRKKLPESALPSIGLIAPYREQVKEIEREYESEKEHLPYPMTIQTIDGFQGQERDIIYISLVRSNEKGDIGFLKDYRRMNVAMTRARKLLVVIGDSATIGQDPFYQDFLDYVEEIGGYDSAWTYIS